VTFLLDVNVLVALLDPLHGFHDAAHDWFAASGARAFATCPLTQNGVLRVVGHPRYPNSPGGPAAVAPKLASLCGLSGHQFWPDNYSLLGGPVEASLLLTSAQVTDSYLLGLAVGHGGKLATFDRRLSPIAVRGGTRALHIIASAVA